MEQPELEELKENKANHFIVYVYEGDGYVLVDQYDGRIVGYDSLTIAREGLLDRSFFKLGEQPFIIAIPLAVYEKERDRVLNPPPDEDETQPDKLIVDTAMLRGITFQKINLEAARQYIVEDDTPQTWKLVFSACFPENDYEMFRLFETGSESQAIQEGKDMQLASVFFSCDFRVLTFIRVEDAHGNVVWTKPEKKSSIKEQGEPL